MALAALSHAVLESSEPAAGDTLTSPLERFRLHFTESVEEEFAVMTLTGADGRVTRLTPRSDPTDIYALIADPPSLAPGGYLLSWRIVSADGHPVGGFIQFYWAVGPAGKTAEEILAGTQPAPEPPVGSVQGQPAGLTGEPPIGAAILRAAAQVALLALAGLLVLLKWGIRIRDKRLGKIERALALATPLLLAADFFLWLQHASPTGSVDGAAISAALSTQNGLLYASRVGLAVLVIWALLLARSRAVAAVLALLAVVATGATGHPAAILPMISVPAKVIHLLAAALWTAGLMVLAFGQRDGEEFRKDAWRVSRIGLTAVVAVAATGGIETLLFLPKLAGLFSSSYGWLVLAKLAGLGVLIVFGWRNRYRLMPALESAGPAPLRRSVTWEIGWMTALVVVAAFLAYIPPPEPRGVAVNMQRHNMSGHKMPMSTEP